MDSPLPTPVATPDVPASIDPTLACPFPVAAGADLCGALAALQAGAVTAEALIEASLSAAQGASAARAFVALDAAGASAAARQADRQRASGRDPGALAGLAVGIKDLFDVQGQRTGAGSRWLAAAHGPASADAPAVARLRAAGAALIGRTQMSEFAFSGLGLNPHDGTPANPVLAALGRPGCLPGGSTSGGAVAVAAGAAWAALGSDTGGSLRIPAALQGLVGFKPTQRLTPLAGTVPLAPSLDTVGAISRSVRDAVRLHALLAARQVALAGRPLRGLRLGWTRRHFLDGLDPAVATDWQAALDHLAAAGAELVELPLPALERLAELTEGGGITAAEAWAWHAPHLDQHGADYDPRVLTRIRRGAAIDAPRLAALHTLRTRWIAELGAQIAGVDLMLAPTVPTVATPIAPLLADDEHFFATNLAMLRNPMVVNLADGCALSLPCQAPGTAPVGLMLWAAAGHDEPLLDAALAIEAVVGPGAAGHRHGRSA